MIYHLIKIITHTLQWVSVFCDIFAYLLETYCTANRLPIIDGFKKKIDDVSTLNFECVVFE